MSVTFIKQNKCQRYFILIVFISPTSCIFPQIFLLAFNFAFAHLPSKPQAFKTASSPLQWVLNLNLGSNYMLPQISHLLSLWNVSQWQFFFLFCEIYLAMRCTQRCAKDIKYKKKHFHLPRNKHVPPLFNNEWLTRVRWVYEAPWRIKLKAHVIYVHCHPTEVLFHINSSLNVQKSLSHSS